MRVDEMESLLPHAPLLSALLDFARSERISFHMPGHRRGQTFPLFLHEAALRLDTTELAATGDLNHPQGACLEAMEQAALYFGAGWTRFITAGSTTGLHILLAGVVGEGGRLFVSRNSHASILHGMALLNIEPLWLESEQPESPASPAPALSDQLLSVPEICRRLLQGRPGDAVLLTSPNYYGHTLDLALIAEAAHRRGIAVLVDEAHGAHFVAAPDILPPTALLQGADGVVQSAHKTLPALTGAAYLHLSAAALAAGRVDARRLARMIPVFQSSSPSFLIAASLDYARAWLASAAGVSAVRSAHRLATNLGTRLPDGFTLIEKPPGVKDPLRLVLDYQASGLSRAMLIQALDQAGIDVEMIDLSRLVLILSPGQPAKDLTRLVACLAEIDKTQKAGSDVPKTQDLELFWLELLRRPVDLGGQSLRTALLGHNTFELVPLQAAAGRRAAVSLVPYPPGCPVILPGEFLSEGHVAFLTDLQRVGITVNGLQGDDLPVLSDSFF